LLSPKLEETSFIFYNSSLLADGEALLPTSTHLAFQKGRQEEKGVGEE